MTNQHRKRPFGVISAGMLDVSEIGIDNEKVDVDVKSAYKT